MQVKRGIVEQDEKGDWWVRVGFGRILPATIAAVEVGGELHLYTGPTSEQTAMGKPPTQGVTAGAIAPPTWAVQTIEQAPPKARQVLALAGDPTFQDWAAKKQNVYPGNIKDAAHFALAFILKETAARVPADFADEQVIFRFDTLVAQWKGAE